MMQLKNLKIHVIQKRKIWYIFSICVILAGIISFAIQGFNFGIDFTGGSYLKLTFYEADTGSTSTDDTATNDTSSSSDVKGTSVSMSDLRSVVDGYVSHTPSIQYDKTNTAYIIRTDITEKTDVDKLLSSIKSEIGPFKVSQNELVGPTIGNELATKAILALSISMVLILIYIAIRFQLYFGISSVLTLIHDALFVLAVFSIFQIEISSSFVAAVLTVVGHSMNATIIVFDRIRENTPNYKDSKLSDLVNDSISATIARTVNMTLCVLFTLFSLYIFGGETTKVFVLAMIIGVTAGFYSSVCLSGSLYYDLQNHFGNKKKNQRKSQNKVANKTKIKKEKEQIA